MKILKILFLSIFAFGILSNGTLDGRDISSQKVFAQNLRDTPARVRREMKEEEPKSETTNTQQNDEIILLAPIPGMKQETRNGKTVGVLSIKEKDSVEILSSYIGVIFQFGFALSGIFAVLMLMIAGYEYMLAGGDSGKTDNAKNRATQALAGVGLLAGAALILHVINPNFFIL